jgi:hypothetical protein
MVNTVQQQPPPPKISILPIVGNDAVVLVAAVEIEEAFLSPLFTSFLLL